MSSTTKSFQMTAHGIFMERRGRAGILKDVSLNKKLCFVATDQALLVQVLGDLAEPDCYYVKYSIEPRDGMYLGRCFLLNDHDVERFGANTKCTPG